MPRRSPVFVFFAATLVAALGVALGVALGGSAAGTSAGTKAAAADRTIPSQRVLAAVAEPSSAVSPDVTAGSGGGAGTDISSIALSPLPTPAPSLSPLPTSSGVGTAAPSPPSPSPAGSRRPLRFVALGDSLTAWPAGDPWPRRLDGLDPAVTLVHNAGVPGNTTAQMRARLGRDVLAYRPGVLFVLGGTNDVGRGIARSTTIANLRAIVETARSRGIRVFLLTIPPDSFPSLVTRVRALNAAIRSLASAEHVALVDIYPPLASAAGLYVPEYTVDGLHFSNRGTALVARTVRLRLAGLGL